MGIEGVNVLSEGQNTGTSDSVERPDPVEEWERKVTERDEARQVRRERLGHVEEGEETPATKVEVNRERQLRLGHIEEEKPKKKSRAKPKEEESKEPEA